MKEAIIGERVYIFSNAAEALDFGQFWHHHYYQPRVGERNYPLYWSPADKLTNEVKIAIGLVDFKTEPPPVKYCVEPPRVGQSLLMSVRKKILDCNTGEE